VVHHLTLPLTRDALKPLRAGDVVFLTGPLYTARDAAHKRIADAAAAGEQPPVSLANATIFYTGPCPAKPGDVIGPLSATTSLRMDRFVACMFRLGMAAMIGKGQRSGEVAALCRQYDGVYFLGIGGAAALIAGDVTACEVAAYEDLGAEAIRLLQVKNMKVFVGIDTEGTVLQDIEIPKYRL
jgi:fumarate hydratase subunit beta